MSQKPLTNQQPSIVHCSPGHDLFVLAQVLVSISSIGLYLDIYLQSFSYNLNNNRCQSNATDAAPWCVRARSLPSPPLARQKKFLLLNNPVQRYSAFLCVSSTYTDLSAPYL